MAEQEDQQSPHCLIYRFSSPTVRFPDFEKGSLLEVVCYRDGARMRRIPRLGIYFCDNDGYIMSLREAETNGLVRSEPVAAEQSH